MPAIRQARGLYSLSGVVHRLSRGLPICFTAQAVNNAAAMPNKNLLSWEKFFGAFSGLGSGTNQRPARFDEHSATSDRSHNPNVDTHSQVPMPHISPYTACAPRSCQR